ncbi:TetR/AcrR family transcriptional regulator [Paenibacillus sp. NPDC058177]|uniref:TetR/AcrR family transcriptional regulator n=1 Tax=Paenibacillus sp. NPDC058177 TaxID=3346369 RepID=UPI0036D8B36F
MVKGTDTVDSAALSKRRNPRSQRAHDAALLAASELLEEGGLPAATVDAISERSGVSKATLYKHWPNRTAIAAEAFGQQMAEAIPLPDTGTAVGDFTEQVRLVSLFYASHAGTIFAQLLADGVFNPESGAFFREFFLSGRRAAIRELWERALARGEVKANIDVETATDILFGPLIFRLMSGHAPLNDEEAANIAFAALNGLMK